MSIQLKRGQSSARKQSTIVLEDGQPFFEKDTKKLYVGDKSTALKNLKPINSVNIQDSETKGSLKQLKDADFTLVNLNSDKTGQTILSDAVGQFSTALGGKSRAEGKRSFTSGTQTIAQGNYSAAFGNNSISEGVNSFVEGSQNISRGNSSHAENANNLAIGDNSHVEGVENTSTHIGAHVQGNKNGSFGKYSHTEGGENVSSTTNDCTYVHVEGYKNTMKPTGQDDPQGSSGAGGGSGTAPSTPNVWATHIGGIENSASGTCSFTGGYQNDNGGNMTFITGSNNVIYNNIARSSLLGYNLKSNADNQTIVGRYNALNKNALFIVGNGSIGKDSNAFSVLADGRVQSSAAAKDSNDLTRLTDVQALLLNNESINNAIARTTPILHTNTQNVWGDSSFNLVITSSKIGNTQHTVSKLAFNLNGNNIANKDVAITTGIDNQVSYDITCNSNSYSMPIKSNSSCICNVSIKSLKATLSSLKSDYDHIYLSLTGVVNVEVYDSFMIGLQVQYIKDSTINNSGTVPVYKFTKPYLASTSSTIKITDLKCIKSLGSSPRVIDVSSSLNIQELFLGVVGIYYVDPKAWQLG